MKVHLFVAGFVVTYVTICMAVMRKWLNESPELTTHEAILLGVSLEQMRNGDLLDA